MVMLRGMLPTVDTCLVYRVLDVQAFLNVL